MDEIQFKNCVMPLHKTLYAYALTILRDECDAADCLQEAFTKLWENRTRLARIDNIAAYATVTVRNVALSMAAKSSRSPLALSDAPPDLSDSSPTPDISLEQADNVRNMAAFLKLLPESQRRVVMLSGVAGLSNSEIKDATGLSDDNVRVLLSRGRKKLREIFSKLK